MMLLPTLAVSPATLPASAVGAGECVVFAPPSGAGTVVGGDERCRRTLSASTFEIPHALIGLQTQIIT